jgi:uncharacterized protein (TIGR02646 family)
MSPQHRAEPPEILTRLGMRWTEKFKVRRQKNPGATFCWPAIPAAERATRLERLNHLLLPILRAQTGECCSFCGRRPVECKTIEHHKPKSRFPDEAYAWNNLFYCCSTCQARKREMWHEHLLKPDVPGYSFPRYFQWNFRKNRIEPSDSASPADRKAAQLTICLYNLNAPDHCLCRRRARKAWLLCEQTEEDLAEADHPFYIQAGEA